MADNVVGQIALELGINTEDFKRQLRNLGKTTKSSMGGITASLKKIAPVVAAAFSVKAIVNFSKECLQLGSDLAEVQNVVDVTFGEMSGAVDKWAKNAMTSFGLSEKVAKEYVGQLGAMSKAFGNSTQEAYNQATSLAGLVGDVASFYNLSTDEAFTKLKAVYTGETEGLKALGVVMTQTALDEYALAKGYGKTTKAMTEQEKVALRLAFVTDRLSGASGDFARTSDGWANQTRVLSLRFEALKATIGQGLINALLPVVRLLNTLLERLQVVADAFSDFMSNLFGHAGSTSSAISSAASGTGAISSNLGDAASSAKAIKKSLAGFDQINILSSGSDDTPDAGTVSGGSIADDAGSVSTEMSAGAAAVGKLKGFLKEVKTTLIEISNITGFTKLWNNFLTGINNAKKGILNLFSAVKSAITATAPNFEGLKTSLINTFLNISNTVTSIWGDVWVMLTENFRLFTEKNSTDIEAFFANVITIFTSGATLISDVVGQLYADLQNWWETNGKQIFDGVINAIFDIGKWALDIYNTVINPVIQKVIAILRDLWEGNLRPLWQNLLGLVSDIGECILTLWNNVLKPVVDWIIKNVGPPISAMFQTLAEKVGIAIEIVSGVLDGLVTALRGVIQFLTGVFSGDWKKAWNGIKNIFTGICQAIRSAIAPILNGILGAMEKFINGIIGGLNWLIKQINKISFDVPDWVPGIGGKKLGFNVKQVSTVNLPRLATGGYVAANTPQLAIIGDNKREGEIVAPESKITEAVVAAFRQFLPLFNNSGNNKPIYLTLKLGDGTFWEGFVDYHNDIVKRTGDTPLLI